MHLLTPEQITEQSGKVDISTRRKLFEEEEFRLQMEIQDVRAKADATKRQIAEENTKFFAEQTAKRTALQKEVGDLETRREEALRPIEELRQRADARLVEAENKLRQAHDETQKNLFAQTQLRQEREAMQVTADTLLEKTQTLTLLEKKLNEQQVAMNEASGNLATQRIEYDKYRQAREADLLEREQHIARQEKAHQDERTYIDQEKTKLKERERGLQSRYHALTLAQEELFDKK